jgi:CubicO group peptidase (beta-lactamase class C family)
VEEVVSGKNWPAFFQTALADPMGLDFTYGPFETGRLGGGGRTNAASYGKLLKLHLAGGLHEGRRILSQQLVVEMQRSNGSTFRNPVPEIDAHGYGMGWWFDAVDAQGRPRIVSDPGAWGAYPWLDRERRYAGFLFVRKALAEGARLQREVRPLIERALDT